MDPGWLYSLHILMFIEMTVLADERENTTKVLVWCAPFREYRYLEGALVCYG